VTFLSEQSGFDIRVAEAAATVATASDNKALEVFQGEAIRLYARADAESIARGDVSETLQEIALRNGIADRAGGAAALQHLLSEAAQGRRALYNRDSVGGDPGLRHADRSSAAFGASDGQNKEGRRQTDQNEPQNIGNADDLKPLEWLDMSKWDNEPVPERKWAIKDRVPLNQAGLFSGEGGTGKSILELTKDVAHVAGRDWLGSLPEPGPAFYIGAEDDENEIHIRLAAIAKHYSVTFEQLVEQGLHVLCLLGKDATLCANTNSKSGRVEVTDLYRRLFEEAGDIKPKNISIDTLSRAFAGNEIDRVQVYAFAMYMQALAAVAGSSVTILSHPSLAGIASGSGISGSTAWHGAFRFRQYLKSVKPENTEDPDCDARALEFKKNQYGPATETILLRYRHGLFLPEPGIGGLDKIAREATADQIFLSLLKRFANQGRNVSHKTTAPNSGPTAFAKEPEAKAARLRKTDLEASMLRLFSESKIRVDSYGRPSRPNERIIAC
jgi:RecA-family ATPase